MSVLTYFAAAGMGKKWHMTSNQYSWLVTIYYFGYIFFQWLVLAWRVVRLPVRPPIHHVIVAQCRI